MLPTSFAFFFSGLRKGLIETENNNNNKSNNKSNNNNSSSNGSHQLTRHINEQLLPLPLLRQRRTKAFYKRFERLGLLGTYFRVHKHKSNKVRRMFAFVCSPECQRSFLFTELFNKDEVQGYHQLSSPPSSPPSSRV